MTDLLKDRDRTEDSGEIVPLSALMDSYVPELDRHRTRSLSGRARHLPPTQALRLADAQPVGAHAAADFRWDFPTGAEVTVAALHPTPPGSPPGPTAPNPPTPQVPPPVRSHRRPRTPWSPQARRALACWLGVAVVELAGLAMLAVTW